MMKNFKGTPGRWIEDNGGIKSEFLEEKLEKSGLVGFGKIAQFWLDLDFHEISEEECTANARLAAAAPDMLEFLLDLYDNPEAVGLFREMELERILKKALGE